MSRPAPFAISRMKGPLVMRNISITICLALACLAVTAVVLADEHVARTPAVQQQGNVPLAGPAATATAGEAQAASLGSEPATSPAGVPDIGINRAEREAIAAGALRMESPAGEASPLQPARSPMMQQIEAVMAEQARQLADLRNELAGAVTSEQAIELQRRAEQVKRRSELEVLQVQARFARERGDEKLAGSIEAAIAWIQDPPPPPAPRHERPVPAIGR